MKFITVFFICMITSGCQINQEANLSTKEADETVNLQPPTTHTLHNNSSCKPGMGWESILKFKPQGFYFFGEIHGTNEIAPLVVEFSCIVAETSQEPTLVLFEVDSFSNDAFSEIYKIPVNKRRQFLIDKLSHFWLLGNQDGRRTEAIMNSMLRVVELNDAGVPIYLGSVGATHEQYLQVRKPESNKSVYQYEFENMLKYQNKFSNIITFTGNWHAFRYAHKMKELGRNDWLAFDQVFLSGEGLNCMDECKINKLGAHRLADELVGHTDLSYVIFTGTHKLFDGYVLTKHATPASNLKERFE